MARGMGLKLSSTASLASAASLALPTLIFESLEFLGNSLAPQEVVIKLLFDFEWFLPTWGLEDGWWSLQDLEVNICIVSFHWFLFFKLCWFLFFNGGFTDHEHRVLFFLLLYVIQGYFLEGMITKLWV